MLFGTPESVRVVALVGDQMSGVGGLDARDQALFGIVDRAGDRPAVLVEPGMCTTGVEALELGVEGRVVGAAWRDLRRTAR